MSVLFEDWQPRYTNITQPKLRSDRASTAHLAAVPVVDQAAATAEAAAATTRHQFLTEVLAVAQVAVQVAAAEVHMEVVPSTKVPLRTTQANP